MIIDRLAFILGRFGHRGAAVATARRWRGAREREPKLLLDVLLLGGVAAPGLSQLDAEGRIDPLRLAVETGRRDLALELAALMGATPDDIATLMRE